MTDPINTTIRPSSLVTWADCGRRWATTHQAPLIAEYGYRLNPRRPMHVGAGVGSGVHAGAAYMLTCKATDGTLGNRVEAEQRAIEEFHHRTEAEGLTVDDTTPTVSIAERQIVRMTQAYRQHVAPATTPLLVETRLDAEVGDGWTLSGQADVISGDPDVSIDDLKTGTTRRANAIQYGAYFMIFQAHGHRPTAIREQFVRRVRVTLEQPKPQMYEMSVTFAVADAMDVIDAIKDRTAEFGRRARGEDPLRRPPPTAFPANPNSPLCGEKWCAAFGTEFCHAHKRGT